MSLLQLARSNVSQHAQVDRRPGLGVQDILTDPRQVRAECRSYVAISRRSKGLFCFQIKTNHKSCRTSADASSLRSSTRRDVPFEMPRVSNPISDQNTHPVSV